MMIMQTKMTGRNPKLGWWLLWWQFWWLFIFRMMTDWWNYRCDKLLLLVPLLLLINLNLVFLSVSPITHKYFQNWHQYADSGNVINIHLNLQGCLALGDRFLQENIFRMMSKSLMIPEIMLMMIIADSETDVVDFNDDDDNLLGSGRRSQQGCSISWKKDKWASSSLPISQWKTVKDNERQKLRIILQW